MQVQGYSQGVSPWYGLRVASEGEASILKGMGVSYAQMEKGEAGVMLSEETFSTKFTKRSLTCPGRRFMTGLKVWVVGYCKKRVCELDGPLLYSIQLICRAPADHNAGGNLDDSKSISLKRGAYTRHEDECRRGTFMHSLSVETKGTCQNKCDGDGPVMTKINFRCVSM